MANLRVLRDGVELHNLDLDKLGKSTIVVGRAPEADLRLDDRAIGREHVVISLGTKGILVHKKTKFGKMSLNGAEISDGVVKPGDVLSIADYLVRIEDVLSSGSTKKAALLSEAPVLIEGGGEPEIKMALISEGDVQAPKQDEPGPFDSNKPIELSATATHQPESSLALDGSPEPSHAGTETVPQHVEGGQIDGSGEDRTAIISTSQVLTKLIFKPGDANVDELIIKKNEISLGRGTNCDVVLTDKKASRKHLVIVRVGMSFIAKDQGSANGTYINGVRINEQELAGDDVLRIGSTEFSFKAMSQEYMAHEQEYTSPPAESLQELPTDPGHAISMEMGLQQTGDPNAGSLQNPATPDPGLAGLAGAQTIPGLGGQSNKKETLLEKFRRQPTPRKLMVIALLAGLVVMLFNQDEDQGAKKKTDPKNQSQTTTPTDAAFSSLPKEKKEFVINTYNLALDYYKGQQYEKAVYEVGKLLEILPGGYKDALEIKRYAEKSIEMVKAQEDEKRRKELEEKLKQEITELVAKAVSLVEKGKEQEAKEVFTQVLEKDPDNPTVLRLRQQIEEKEQRAKAEAEAQRENDFKRKELQNLLKTGHELVKAGKYYEAIEKMKDAPVVFSGDSKLLDEAKEIIAEARNTLKAKLEPLLAQGRKAIDEGNYPAARDAFFKALKIDSKSTEALKGLSKIREILHARAKRIYIDAILIESGNDYRTAKTKYKECLELAMPDDIYFARCNSKYKRLEFLDRGTGDESASRGTAAASADSLDPALPKLPQPVDVDGNKEGGDGQGN